MNNEVRVLNATCVICNAVFHRRRKDKIYCSDACRKTASSRKDRLVNPYNSTHSATKRRQIADLYDLNSRLNEMIYGTAPNLRQSVLLAIIEAAEDGAGRCREVLTNRTFLFPDRNERHLFHRKSPAVYATPAQLANKYCWETWGCGVRAVLQAKPQK